MDTIDQARDFTQFVAGLPEDERTQHIDALYDRWREKAFASEDLKAVEESLQDYRAGERGRPHADVMRDLRAGLGSGTSE